MRDTGDSNGLHLTVFKWLWLEFVVITFLLWGHILGEGKGLHSWKTADTAEARSFTTLLSSRRDSKLSEQICAARYKHATWAHGEVVGVWGWEGERHSAQTITTKTKVQFSDCSKQNWWRASIRSNEMFKVSTRHR